MIIGDSKHKVPEELSESSNIWDGNGQATILKMHCDCLMMQATFVHAGVNDFNLLLFVFTIPAKGKEAGLSDVSWSFSHKIHFKKGYQCLLLE